MSEEPGVGVRRAHIFSQAEAVYGSRERALAWLERPNPRLSQRTPLELLTSDEGSRIVEELLVQIDEGIFV
jgi:putative toxin-antitoxin system antitoxin component (TIGR02293 family)